MIEPEKNVIRLCAALDGFKELHGTWPATVVVYPRTLDRLKEFLGDESFSTVERKVTLVPGPSGFRAEGEGGSSYDYGQEGFPENRPNPSAMEWLGLSLEKIWNDWLARRSGDS